MSLLRNSSSKTFRAVGLGVGSNEIEGAIEMVGAMEGDWEMLGGAVGAPEGLDEIDGSKDGCEEMDGIMDGWREGWLDGAAEVEGCIDGSAEVEGCIDGIPDGASLCGKAPAMTKSDAVADAAFEIAVTLSGDTLLAGIVPSKLSTAMPLTSYFIK